MQILRVRPMPSKHQANYRIVGVTILQTERIKRQLPFMHPSLGLNCKYKYCSQIDNIAF